MRTGFRGTKIIVFAFVLLLWTNTIVMGSADAAYVGSSTDNVLQQMQLEKKHRLPQGFVYLDEVIPTAHFEIRYYGDNNFVGSGLMDIKRL